HRPTPRLTRGFCRRAKRSFADMRSQTEFGNEERTRNEELKSSVSSNLFPGQPATRGTGSSRCGLFRRPFLGAHGFRQETAVVHADLRSHQLVEQAVQAQDHLLILLRLQGQVAHLVPVGLEVENLNVVVLEKLVQRLRRVEGRGRVKPAELVTAIKGERQ